MRISPDFREVPIKKIQERSTDLVSAK